MLYLLDIYEMASTATLHIAIASYYYILSLCFKTSIYEVFNVNVIPDQRLLYYCLSLNLKIFVLFCFADYIYRKSCFINNDVNTFGRKKKVLTYMAHRELTFLRQIKSINVRESKQWEILHNVSAKRVILIKSLLCSIQKISKIGGKSTTPPPQQKMARISLRWESNH